MTSTSLYDDMQKYYVDAEENTIVEAVELGMSVLTFLSDLHSCIEIASRKNNGDLGSIVCDYFISLSLENFSVESIMANKSQIDSQIVVIKSKDTEIGIKAQEITMGSFLSIAENEFFNHPTCKLLLAAFLVESVVKTCNAHVFCKSEDTNVLLTYSNMQSSYHVLAIIALLCNADQIGYYQMNLKVEKYANEVTSSLRSLIEKSAMEAR